MESIRAALRSLARSPGYSALVVGTLAIALGLSSAVYAAISAATRPTSPFADADRLYVVHGIGAGLHGTVRPVDRLEALEREVPGLAGMARLDNDFAFVETRHAASQEYAVHVDANFFSVIGSTPAEGRFFVPADTLQSDAFLAVVSDRLWRRSFGGRSFDDDISMT